jgi:hypothetical protein
VADLVELGLIPLVTGLVQAAKQAFPESARDRWTTAIALACGVAIMFGWRLAAGQPVAGSQAVADAILRGLATGLSAIGFYHVIGDARTE